MKNISLIALFTIFTFTLFADNSLTFKRANDFYANKKYEEAIVEYQKIRSAGEESLSLYYNLGNAYYRVGNYPEAIYFYEKARLISPGDDDVVHNLRFAETQLFDKITPVNKPAIVRMYQDYISGFSEKFWAILSISAFVLLLLSATFYLFGSSKKLKISGFIGGITFFSVSVFGFVFSQKRHAELVNPKTAIVFNQAVSVKSEPDNSSTELFIIHEGLKVSVEELNGNWMEIRLADDRVGWIPKSAAREL